MNGKQTVSQATKNIISSRPHQTPRTPASSIVGFLSPNFPEEKLVLDGGEKGLQLTCQRTVKWAFGMTSAWRMRLRCYQKRNPGAQLVMDRKYSPLQLFQLFFPYSVGNTIAKNTNSYAKIRTDAGNKFMWLYSYIALVIYMGLLSTKNYCRLLGR